MDFIKLNIANFLTIGHSGDIHLKDRGLNLIQGVNDDDSSATSNGSGKSSIPDALCWALYGTTARGESGDAVVNSIAGKECAVLVEVEDGSAVYSITRYRKHKTGKNSVTVTVVNGMGLAVLTKGTDKETQLVIDELLGCSYEVFKAAIYAGQEDMPDIPKMRDKALKMLIEEAAGVQRLEKAYELARGRAFTSARAVETDEVMIDRTKLSITKTAVELEAAKLKRVEHETARAARIAVLEAQSAAAKTAASDIVAGLKKYDEPAILAQVTTLRNTIAGSDAARNAVTEHRTKNVNRLTNARAVAEATANRVLNEAKALRDRHDNAQQELGKPCHACGKPHTPDELEQLKAVIKAQLTARAGEAGDARHACARVQLELDVANTALAALEAAVPDVSALVAEERALMQTQAQIAALKNQARARITEAQNALALAQTVRSEANPQDALIVGCNERIADAEAAIEKWTTGLVALRRAMEVDAAVVSVYSPAGVRAHILDTVTPFLNDRTSEYLSTLSDGNISAVWSTLSRTAKGELREKFVIDVEHAKGGKSFGLISGGEKRKVRLACMLALQDLVASRATKPMNLWMGDEIDDAMDPAGIERLMAILEKKAREKGTVLVISHNELRDWIDDVTLVRKSGGVSTVEGALTALY